MESRREELENIPWILSALRVGVRMVVGEVQGGMGYPVERSGPRVQGGDHRQEHGQAHRVDEGGRQVLQHQGGRD